LRKALGEIDLDFQKKGVPVQRRPQMFNFSHAIVTAVVVLGGLSAASAAAPGTLQDESDAWYVQTHFRAWNGSWEPATAVPPVYVLPFTLREQERLDLADGNIG
jgi:hypothetical protein